MARQEDGRRGGAGARVRPVAAPGWLPVDDHWRAHLKHLFAARQHEFKALVALEIEHRALFLWLPVAFGAGILAYFAAPQEPRLWHGPLLAALALVPALLDSGVRKVLAIGLLFAALGFSAATWRTAQVHTPMLARPMIAEVQGYIETLDIGEGRLRMTLRPVFIADVPPLALPRALRIGAPAASEVVPGDFVTLRARLMPPSEAAMPGGYDFRRDSFFKGIGGVGYALGKPAVVAPPQAPPRDIAFRAWVDSGRNWLTARIAGTIGGQAGALSAALITGKRALISETTNDDLRAAGLYHIVSISGIHMVLAAGVLFWSVRALLAAFPALALGWPLKKIAAVFAMLGATFYCVFSGSEVATERSLIMTLVMLGAVLVDRPALAMRNLALSALIVLAREPESLIGPSFQMSFAAVACLIGANRVWLDWRRNHAPREWGPVGKVLRVTLFAFLGMVATTLVATLATGPFSVFHFHRVNPFGLIGNALALPLVSIVVMPCAVIGTLLAPLNLDWIVWRIMGEGVGGVLFVAEWVGRMENASYAIERFTLPAFGLMVLSLLLFVNFRTKLRALALAPLLLLLVVPRHPPPPDLVVDASGKSALVRGADGAFRLLAPNANNRFTLAQWLPAVGDARLVRDPTLRESVTCDRSGCTLAGTRGELIALSLTPQALREDCTRAGIVITPLPAPGGCTARLLLDRAHFERKGATFIALTEGQTPRLDVALDDARRRPWRRTPATDRQAGLLVAPLARQLSPDAWPQRADGRRFFGLLPPPAARPDNSGMPLAEEDPALLEAPPSETPASASANATPQTEEPTAPEEATPDTPPPEAIQ